MPLPRLGLMYDTQRLRVWMKDAGELRSLSDVVPVGGRGFMTLMLFVLVMAVASVAVGVDERDAAYWTKGGDQVFLVLAEVMSVESVERFANDGGDSRDYSVTLRPVATLAGSLDVSTHDLMTVEFRYVRCTGMRFNPDMIVSVPVEGAWVLVAPHCQRQ